ELPTLAGTLSNTAAVPNPGDPFPANNSSTPFTTVLPAGTPTPTATPTATATATATVAPTPMPAAQALNLSTRMRVQTGDNVGIGGVLVPRGTPGHLLLRALGPSLAQFGVPRDVPEEDRGLLHAPVGL